LTKSSFSTVRLITGICGFILLVAASARADVGDYFGLPVTELTYTGVRTVDTALIRRVSGIETGSLFNAGMAQEAIRQLYALSLFSDIQVLAERAAPGVRVILALTEYPRLRSVAFEGNKKLKEKELKDRIVLVTGQIVSPDQIKQAERSLLNLYKEKGYYFSRIEPDSRVAPDSSIDLVFQIDEGRKVKIKKVVITGAEQLSPGEVAGQMDNRSDSWWRSGNYKPDKYPEDLKKIVANYKKKGFLDAAVLSDTVFVNDSIGGLEIDIAVHEGRRYYFGTTSFSGNTLYTDEQLRHVLKYTEGEVFSEKKFDESVNNMYTLLQERGRLYAQIINDQVPHDSIVDISFTLTENEPAKVRYVVIEGNEKTKEKVIRRELSLFPGATYRRSDLERSIRDLMVLNYFETVEPDFSVLPNGDIDVTLDVKEKSTGQISVGGGYSGQDKFVGTLGFTVPNFLGNGQSLALNGERGSRRSSFDISFTEPWFRDTRTSVGVDFFSLSRRSYDNNYDEERSGLGLRVGRRLRWPDRYTSVFLSGRIQDVGYTTFEPTYITDWASGLVSGPDPNGKWPQRLSSATFSVVRDSRDLAQFATRGARINASFEYAGDAVGGFWHYHKELLDVQKYFPIYKSVALVLKGRWGFISPTVTDDLVPYSEEFQVGGTNGDGTVRGYDEGTAGVRIESGSRTPVVVSSDRPDDFNHYTARRTPTISYDRARSMSVYNVELQFPIAPPQIYGLLFFDAGRGFASTSAWRLTGDLWRSAGLGARMVVPGIGTIGFDFGYGFDDDVVGGWRPHFQIGRGL
jgi:outer membrane protein insertion porin family